jgi:phage repressor protein C with HTH and peptisase S24 domain
MELQGILARIDRRLQAVGLSESAASKLAKKPDAIRNLRRAVEQGDRQGMSTATLNALAPVLKTTAVWLFAEAGPEEIGPHTAAQMMQAVETGRLNPLMRLVEVPEVGIAEAGAFREVSEFIDDDALDRPYIVDVADREFPDVPLKAWRVAGDSMNALKPRPILEGDRVIGLDFEGLKGRVPLRDGMVVVLEQTLSNGLHRELSVKQVEIHEDRTEFHPRSTNKRHKPIIVPRELETDDGRTIRILALVRKISNDVPLS